MSASIRPTGATDGATRPHGRPTDAVVVDSGTGAAPAERAVPYHCPFCAEEDLRPHEAARGAWHCRSCLRVFSVRFHGLAPLDAAPDPLDLALEPLDPAPATPAPTDPTTGGPR